MSDFQVGQRYLPALLGRVADWIAGLRAGIDASRIDLLTHPPAARPPVLLIHGDLDKDIPVQTSREFAAAAPGLNWPVRYEEFPGAGHSQAWNRDRARYERILTEFLSVRR